MSKIDQSVLSISSTFPLIGGGELRQIAPIGLILQTISLNGSVSKLFLKGVRFLHGTPCKTPLQLAKWLSEQHMAFRHCHWRKSQWFRYWFWWYRHPLDPASLTGELACVMGRGGAGVQVGVQVAGRIGADVQRCRQFSPTEFAKQPPHVVLLFLFNAYMV